LLYFVTRKLSVSLCIFVHPFIKNTSTQGNLHACAETFRHGDAVLQDMMWIRDIYKQAQLACLSASASSTNLVYAALATGCSQSKIH
jgi:hypothetical protein